MRHAGDGRLCRHAWRESTPLPWDREVERFFAAFATLDARLATEAALGYRPELLFQGPVADGLSHVGQIALMLRLAGTPVRGESYFEAEITAGRVGPEQAPPRREFE